MSNEITARQARRFQQLGWASFAVLLCALLLGAFAYSSSTEKDGGLRLAAALSGLAACFSVFAAISYGVSLLNFAVESSADQGSNEALGPRSCPDKTFTEAADLVQRVALFESRVNRIEIIGRRRFIFAMLFASLGAVMAIVAICAK